MSASTLNRIPTLIRSLTVLLVLIVWGAIGTFVYPPAHFLEGRDGRNSLLPFNEPMTSPISVRPWRHHQPLQEGMMAEDWSSPSQMPPSILTYPSGSTTANEEVAALAQKWQKNLGTSVKSVPIDFNKLPSETEATISIPHGLQYWSITWILGHLDTQGWMTFHFCNGCQNNSMNYGQNQSDDVTKHQQVQQSLVADSMPNSPVRYTQYNSAEQRLVNAVTWLPMEQATNTIALKPYVKNVVLNAQDSTTFNDWDNVYADIGSK